jgi:hypothetical protein
LKLLTAEIVHTLETIVDMENAGKNVITQNTIKSHTEIYCGVAKNNSRKPLNGVR